MSFTLAIVILGFLVVVLLAGLITLLILYYKNKPMVPVNSPLLINFAPEFTNGFSVFQEVSMKKFPNGRTLSKLVPKDINQDESLLGDSKPEVQYLVCAPGCRVAVPVGDLSSSRTVIFCMPPTPEQLNSAFKKTALGVAMTKAVDFEQISNIIDERVKKIREVVSKTATKGEEVMSKIFLDNLDEMSDRLHKFYSKTDEKKLDLSRGGYNPIPPSY